VRVGIGRVGVVQVVGRNHRQLQVAGELQQPLADPRLDLEAVVHELEVEVAGTEDVPEVGGTLARLLEFADA
jgi:hypothetical protein